jgi:Ca2+-binding RTX toxin-like protein
MRRVILLLTVMAATLVVASGVALAVTKIGTNGPDTLRGTNGDDNLLGKGGNDIILGLAGNDDLLGGPGKDIVLGGTLRRAFGGDKNLAAGRGNDVVAGGNGSDNVVGGSGNDLMADGEVEHDQSEDILSGGAGNDAIIVVNSPAFEDKVTCGGGFDRVLADRKDVVAPDCERVFIGVASFDAFFESIPQSFFEGLHPLFSP